MSAESMFRAVCHALPGRLTDEEADSAVRAVVVYVHSRLETLGDLIYDGIRCGDPHDDAESKYCTRCEDRRDGVDVMINQMSQFLSDARRRRRSDG